jgi:hypothetical protein
MAKGWRPGAKSFSLDGKIETARAPTEGEESALFFALMDWRETHPDWMSPKLWEALRQYFEWPMSQRPWSRRQIKRFRWWLVRNGRYRLGLRWDEAYEYASRWCKGSPAKGSPRTMREDYTKEQRNPSPPELRQQPTYFGEESVIPQKLPPNFRKILADVARELRENYFPAPKKCVERSSRPSNRSRPSFRPKLA